MLRPTTDSVARAAVRIPGNHGGLKRSIRLQDHARLAVWEGDVQQH